MKKIIFLICLLLQVLYSNYDFEFSVLKYGGGGDWYEGLVGAKELMKHLQKETGLNPNLNPVVIEPGDSDLNNHPFIYLTGHGVIRFNQNEKKYIQNYLLQGGFIYANDDYGMDTHFKKAIAEIFPEKEWVKLPNSHEIFSIYHQFPLGTPKIHEHDNKEPSTYALYHNQRIIILYTHEADIGDGWAPFQVHKDPQEKRLAALNFGINIILYHLNH